jgi:carbamoyltransferase
MNILGISALYHDSAAALCIDGKIIAAAQEERFTRKKHDLSFPINAINYCLQDATITNSQLDAIVFYDNPLLTLDRWVSNITELGENSKTMIDKSFDSVFKSRLQIHKILESRFGLGRKNKLLVCKHHISHAASAFYPSPFESAAILTIDGVGEWTTTAIGKGKGSDLELIKEIHYPHSLGLLYSAFTYFCGFKVNSGDYKLMGLAPYGESIYYDLIKRELIDIKSDGSFRLNMEYFDYHRNIVMTNEKFSALFGGLPREREAEITKREMDIAASAQKVIEEAVLLLAKHAIKITGEKNLVMAGGVALNCVANGKLLTEGFVENIWVQPAAGDAGGALGAALYATHAYFKQPRMINKNGRDSQKGSYLGPSFSNRRITEYLDNAKAVYEVYSDKTELYNKAAQYIADGAALGFFNGRMEYGPRALGARSILADPRNPETQSRLNLKIKYRESFRPFAPSVLVEKSANYFELDRESPYMLLVAPVKKEIRKNFNIRNYTSVGTSIDMLSIVNKERSELPAITHVDYSARIQTVNKFDNEDYYNLIAAFEKLTGCGVIVNTSFNVRGEPIVCSPEDAYLCFMRTDMDVLIMENTLLLKNKQPELKEDANWRNIYELD